MLEPTLAIVVLLNDLCAVYLSKTVIRGAPRRTGVGQRSTTPGTTAPVQNMIWPSAVTPVIATAASRMADVMNLRESIVYAENEVDTVERGMYCRLVDLGAWRAMP